jgi:predicted DNA-binding protein (UPF0251 family)
MKYRMIENHPPANLFKPAGIPQMELEEVPLTLDEFEAMRLADYEGLYQEEAAKRMEISRQTFGNIIEAARKKVADVLINGKALRIEGGHVNMATRIFICRDCSKEWTSPLGTGHPDRCPTCGGKNFYRKMRGRDGLGEAQCAGSRGPHRHGNSDPK